VAIRLLIADDHELVREGLRSVFMNTEVEIVAEAATCEGAMRRALESNVDVVLLDIKMPDGSGIDVLGQIKSAKPDLPVLMYSAHDSQDYMQRCAALGAWGYLSKGTDKQVLLSAVRAAYGAKPTFHPKKPGESE
jgi:DNA-binding NarL/FixJ family response regulator